MSKTKNGAETAQENNNQVETKAVVKSTETTQVVTKITETVGESIEELKKKLEIQLKAIERKNELAGHRDKFLITKKELSKVKIYLKKELVFESNYVSLTFKAPTERNNYSQDLFSIGNKDLLLKFIDVLDVEINKKISEIETELIN